jgi:hypothetical protein
MFQPETWDFAYGEPFTKATEDEIIAALRPPWIQGLSILGGDPMEPEKPDGVLPFLRRVKKNCGKGYLAVHRIPVEAGRDLTASVIRGCGCGWTIYRGRERCRACLSGKPESANYSPERRRPMGMIDLASVIGVYPICNTGAVLVHKIDYGEEKVLASHQRRGSQMVQLDRRIHGNEWRA